MKEKLVAETKKMKLLMHSGKKLINEQRKKQNLIWLNVNCVQL